MHNTETHTIEYKCNTYHSFTVACTFTSWQWHRLRSNIRFCRCWI